MLCERLVVQPGSGELFEKTSDLAERVVWKETRRRRRQVLLYERDKCGRLCASWRRERGVQVCNGCSAVLQRPTRSPELAEPTHQKRSRSELVVKDKTRQRAAGRAKRGGDELALVCDAQQAKVCLTAGNSVRRAGKARAKSHLHSQAARARARKRARGGVRRPAEQAQVTHSR